jgi:hypothetical protein
MANYTPKQRSEIEYLIERGKKIYKKLTNKKNAGESEKLNDELNNIKMQLNEALNAEAMYRAHLRAAEEHIKAAEGIRAKWCGGDK